MNFNTTSSHFAREIKVFKHKTKSSCSTHLIEMLISFDWVN